MAFVGKMYQNARQNATSFQAVMAESGVNPRGGNVRVNLAKRLQSTPVALDMEYIETLFDFYDNDEIVRRTEELMTNHIYQQRPQFHANDVHLQLSKDFLKIVDEEYMRFSKDAYACIRVMGFVPMQYVILASGFVVPRVVPRGTYKISVYYDFIAESLCYKVFRTVNGGKSVSIGQGLMSDFQRSVNNRELSGASNMSVLDHEMTRDPRESASVRIDMGTHFPKDDGHDPTIIVLDHFGYRPTKNGQLRSLVHTLYPLHKEIQRLKRYYFQGQRRIMQEEPYIETSDISEEQKNQGMQGSVYNNSMDSARKKAGDRYANQHYDAKRVAKIQREEQLRKQFGDLAEQRMEEVSYEENMDGNFKASTVSHLYRFDTSSPIFDISTKPRGFGRSLLAGEKVANFRLGNVDASHLPFLIERYESSVSNILGVPQAFFELNRGTQENIALHIRTFFKTQHAQFKLLGGLLTDVYNQIYAPSEGSWYAHVYFDRFLRKEVIRDMARDYKLYYKALKHADPHLFALIKKQSVEIEELVIHQFETHTGRKAPPRVSFLKNRGPSRKKKSAVGSQTTGKKPENGIHRSEKDIPYTRMLDADQPLESDTLISDEEKKWDKKYRAPQVGVAAHGIVNPQKATADPLAAFDDINVTTNGDNPEATLESLTEITRLGKRHTAEKNYEDAMLNEEIRALMFLGTLQRQQTDTIFKIYTMAGDSKAELLNRMFENFMSIQSNMRVTISFASNANMDLNDLLVRGSLGFMTEKEIYDIVRTQASMPIDADTWTGSANLKYVMKAVRENVVEDITAALELGKRKRPTEAANGSSSSSSSSSSSDSSTSKRQKVSAETSKTTSSTADKRSSVGTSQKILNNADSKKTTKSSK